MSEGWDYTNHAYRDIAVDGNAKVQVVASPTYTGLSTAKPYPTAASPFVTGISFFETDTGRTRVWDGVDWRLVSADEQVTELLTMLLLEVRKLRLLVEVAAAS